MSHPISDALATIVLIGGEKGGTAKTTTATNVSAWIAHEGGDVMLLDADPQGSANKFIQRRNAARKLDPSIPPINIVQKHGDVYETALDLAKRCQVLIIDAGGRDSEEFRTAMMAADLLLTPIKASQADLETLPYVNQMVKTARQMGNRKLKAYAFISMAPTSSFNTEALAAKELLEEAQIHEIKVANSVIQDRKVYRDALGRGLSVLEMKNSQAKAEVQLLCQEFFRNN